MEFAKSQKCDLCRKTKGGTRGGLHRIDTGKLEYILVCYTCITKLVLKEWNKNK